MEKYRQQVECNSQTGLVTVTFNDLYQDFLLSGFKINGSLRRFNIYFANKCDGSCFNIKFNDIDFKVGEINESINIPITKQTVINIESVPYGEKIELLLYSKIDNNNMNYKLSGGHVNAKEEPVAELIKPFFMVFADKPSNYNKMPTIRHETEEEAEREAVRLANKEKCETFVFKSVKKISLVPNIQKID